MAASSLDASIIIGAAEPQKGWLTVSITFSQGGREVDLDVGDSLQCNGFELNPVSLPFQPRRYSAYFKRADAAAYEFIYRHHGKSTSIRIPSLDPPKITSPQTGALLDRGAGFTMTYEPARGGHVSVGIYVTTTDGLVGLLGGPEQPDLGTYTFDPSMLTPHPPVIPGPGWAWLELRQQVKTTPSDTGFKSVAITNNAALATVQIRLR